VKENSKRKRTGLVTASPSEFLVHQRFGRTRFFERGRAAWVLPWVDRYALIPSSVHSLSFCADQITAENQGVEVSGFAIWSVVDPKRAVEAVDFTESAEAIGRIGEHLREVVESAIRHQVANLTLEETLRKRGSIIERLKEELAGVANHWGLHITTVEIKTVRIMSAQLFENMQARFRDSLRLESERSAMETDELIQRGQATAREEVALREMAFREAESHRNETLSRAEIERNKEIERLRAAKRIELELATLGDQLELTKEREAKRREALESERALMQLDATLEKRRFELEQARAKNRDAMAEIDDTIERRRIATANTKDAARLFLENLPGLVAGMKIENLNLGDPALVGAIARLAGSITNPLRSGGLYTPGDE
jgi:flotillin